MGPPDLPMFSSKAVLRIFLEGQFHDVMEPYPLSELMKEDPLAIVIHAYSTLLSCRYCQEDSFYLQLVGGRLKDLDTYDYTDSNKRVTGESGRLSLRM